MRSTHFTGHTERFTSDISDQITVQITDHFTGRKYQIRSDHCTDDTDDVAGRTDHIR